MPDLTCTFTGAPHAVGGEAPKRVSFFDVSNRSGTVRIISDDQTYAQVAWFISAKLIDPRAKHVEVIFIGDGPAAEASRMLQNASLRTGSPVEVRFSFLQGKVFSPVRTFVLKNCESVELGGTMVKGRPASRWLLKAAVISEELDQ